MDDTTKIYRELAGSKNTPTQIVSTSPLLFAAIGLIFGIVIQRNFAPTIIAWLILLAGCAVTAAIVFRLRTKSLSLHFLAYTALVAFVCLGAIRLTGYQQPKENDIRNFVGDKRQLAAIRGVILTEPYTNENKNWAFARFKPSDSGSSFYLRLTELKSTKDWVSVSGKIRVQVNEPVLDLKAGNHIQAYCWLNRFGEPTNPGQFNTAKYLAGKNVFVAASIKSCNGIEILHSAQNNRRSGIFTKTKRKLRQTATQALLGDLSIEDQSRGLLEALLLGYRGHIDSSTYNAFRKTGLLHFISLSGLHLGILIGTVWWLCKTAGLMKPTRAIVCIVATGIFLMIVPPRAPTIRAAIICCIFCTSFFFLRKSNPLNTLSLAAIVLLLIRPTNLFEVGWQLSFASVLGIILFTERTHFFLYEKITASLPRRKKTPKINPFYRIALRPRPYILRLLSIGFAAWLGGAGILLYHFYTISPFTSIWTVIAFPLVAWILTIGFLKIILSLLLPTVGALLGIVVSFLSGSLIWIVERIANLGISEILIGYVSSAPIIFYYGFIFCVAFVNFRWPLLKRTVCIGGILVITFFLGVTKWQRTCRDDLILTILDVGHGQAILAQLPEKTNILFDAGSLHKANVGSRIVIPFLRYSAIKKIDSILISHNDVDHINGIAEIARNNHIRNVYADETFLSHPDLWKTATFLRNYLRAIDLDIKPVEKNMDVRNITLRVLWPTEPARYNDSLGDNDKSLVILIEYVGQKILLCSDIEKYSQQQLLKLYPNLKLDVMVAPHHGSVKTFEAEFLTKLEPEIVICSCGKTQYEKGKTIKPTENIKSFYTARDGAITVRVEKNGAIHTDIFKK